MPLTLARSRPLPQPELLRSAAIPELGIRIRIRRKFVPAKISSVGTSRSDFRCSSEAGAAETLWGTSSDASHSKQQREVPITPQNTGRLQRPRVRCANAFVRFGDLMSMLQIRPAYLYNEATPRYRLSFLPSPVFPVGRSELLRF